MRRLSIILLCGVLLTCITVCWLNSGAVRSNPLPGDAPKQPELVIKALEAPAASSFSGPDKAIAFYDPLVISPCNLAPVSEQDVSSQVDGIFEAIHVDLGQHVEKGALLGKLDDRQFRAQIEALEIRAVSTAAESIAKAQFDEADSKVQYALKANESGLTTVPELEYKSYLFQRERFAQEMKKAREEREGAQKELERARVVLGLHEIRSALEGEIVKVYKRNGEAVKQAEPLFRIASSKSLRIEGLCKVQQAILIQVGMRALVEPELRGEQMTELAGHTAPVTAIAVSADGRMVASASEDRNVLLWSWPGGARIGLLPHPAEVLAVAVGKGNTILTGCADGQLRLWRLQADSKVYVPLNFSHTHEGGIRAVAFSADGGICATGGDDKRIGIWEVATGKHRMWLQPDEGMPAHQGAVTSLQFTPDGHLVSAGRDNVLKVWSLQATARLSAVHTGRTGDVANLGISPNGRHVLLDMGEELRILDRENGTRLGSLQNLKQGRFQSLAQYSPSGRLLLTEASSSRLQLWRAPATAEEAQFFRRGYADGFHRGSLLALGAMGSHSSFGSLSTMAIAVGPTPAPKLWQVSGQEIRHFAVQAGAIVHCGVFAPDESVVFTGGTDKTVHVWAVPPARHWSQPLEARITFIGNQIERGTDMVRIRAEVENPCDPQLRLRAGLFAVMRLFPETTALK